jgi:hypothetical protein
VGGGFSFFLSNFCIALVERLSVPGKENSKTRVASLRGRASIFFQPPLLFIAFLGASR